MIKKYETIFFDLDNTLWDFEKNSLEAMKLTCEKLNVCKGNNEFDRFYKVYLKHNENLWNDYRTKIITKKELVFKRFKLTFDELEILDPDPVLANEIYLSLMPYQTVLSKGVVDVLEYLKFKGYDLHIITNGFSEVQIKKLENSGIHGYFRKIFISEEILATKPENKIFEHALKSSNARKKKSLMIGDDWETDILGAVNFGMDAVHVSSENKSILSKKQYAGQLIFQINELKEIKLLV